MKSLVYIDNSALARPDDALLNPKFAREATLVRHILDLCDEGRLRFVFSEWLSREMAHEEVNQVTRLRRYRRLPVEHMYVALDDGIYAFAAELLELPGVPALNPKDALHLASAQRGGADHFITCDKGILRWAKNKRMMGGLKVAYPGRFLKDLIRG
jgi:predicted nucleic acid-binding protein